MAAEKITVKVKVNAPVAQVWTCWTEVEHIKNWCFASEDWYVPDAHNDLQLGGKFGTMMSAKNGEFAFEFSGYYTDIQLYKTIAYTTDDQRTVAIEFVAEGDNTTIIETFEAETENSIEMQKEGWQAILNQFEKYVSSLK